MNNVIERKWCTKGTVYIEDLTGTAFTGEDGGHTFVISGVNPDGTAVTLAGTVAGAYILPDGSTQPLTGSIADGKAQITLDPECYALPGRGQLTIFLMASGQKVAIYGAVLNVARSSTDQVPPAITADVADLVSDIEEARASIPASYTNLMASLAKNYANLTYPVKVGTYAWQDGWMYRAKVDIPSAESWTESHWEKVPLADSLVNELSALKSALDTKSYLDITGEWDKEIQNLNYSVWKNGVYASSTGNISANSGFLATEDFLPDDVEFIAVDSGYSFSVSIWESDGTYVSRDNDGNTYSFYVLSHMAGRKYKVNLKRTDGNSIALSEAKHIFFGNLRYSNISDFEYGYIASGGAFTINKNGNNIITRDFVTSYAIKIDTSVFNKICLVKYNPDGTFVSRSTSFFNSTDYYTVPSDGYKYKVMFIKNDTTIHPDVINSGITFIEKTWSNPLEYGGISQSNGALTVSSTEVRSTDYIATNVNSIALASGVQFAIARYQNNTLVSRSNFVTGGQVFDHSAGYQYKIVIKKENGSVINPDEIDSLVTFEVNGENGTPWVKGYISINGTPSFNNHMYYTYDFIDSSIIGVDIKSLDCAISIAVYSSEGVFQSRTSFSIAPYYAFDHVNHKYRVNFNDYVSATIEDTEKVVFIKNSLISNIVMGRMFGVSDMKRFVSGDNTNIAYDSARGMCYLVYGASTGEYGETYFDVRLSVFPVDQPYRAEYYDIISAGQTIGGLTLTRIQDLNIIMMEEKVRICLFESETKEEWYVDFDKTTHEKTASKAYIRIGNAEPVVMGNASLEQYYDDNNLTKPDQKITTFTSNIVQDDGYYYSILTYGNLSYPIIVRSLDCTTWEFVYRIDHQCQYEASIAKVGNYWYVTIRLGNTYVLNNTFSTITAVSANGNYITQGNTKPDIIKYGDDVIIGVSENNVFANKEYVSHSRQKITLLKGNGTDLSKYKKIMTLIHKDGIAMYRFVNVNGILYIVTALGHLYYTRHPNGAACKDGLYFAQIGDLTLLDNLT